MKTQILNISTNESVDSISSNNLAPYPGQYVARAVVQIEKEDLHSTCVSRGAALKVLRAICERYVNSTVVELIIGFCNPLCRSLRFRHINLR